MLSNNLIFSWWLFLLYFDQLKKKILFLLRFSLHRFTQILIFKRKRKMNANNVFNIKINLLPKIKKKTFQLQKAIMERVKKITTTTTAYITYGKHFVEIDCFFFFFFCRVFFFHHNFQRLQRLLSYWCFIRFI